MFKIISNENDKLTIKNMQSDEKDVLFYVAKENPVDYFELPFSYDDGEFSILFSDVDIVFQENNLEKGKYGYFYKDINGFNRLDSLQVTTILDKKGKREQKSYFKPLNGIFKTFYPALEFFEYKVTIIMAVYNVEQFLADALNSLIVQSIGFENIQVLLVNDASPDNSKAIAIEYAEKYDNITYLKNNVNSGVAITRNKALPYIKGELVSFMDPDDMLSPETIENVYKFYQKHKGSTDVVSIPLEFFGDKKGQHPLNYKYEKTQLVDLYKNPSFIQLSSSSAFIAQDKFTKDKLKFPEDVIVSEDFLLLNEIIADKMTLGVVKESLYMYRKHGKSALDTIIDKKENYVPRVENLLSILHKARAKFGFIPKYYQWAVCYDLMWLLKVPKKNAKLLSSDEIAEYQFIIDEILLLIDYDIINSCKHANYWIKKYYLPYKLKQSNAVSLNMGMHVSDSTILYEKRDITLNLVGAEKNEVGIRLFGNLLYPSDFERFANARLIINEKYYYFNLRLNDKLSDKTLSENYRTHFFFTVDIPLSENMLNEVILFEAFNGQDWIIPVRTFGKFLSLNPARQFSRTIIDDNYDLVLDNKKLKISNQKEKNNLKVNQFLQTVDFKLFRYYQDIISKKTKPIWLISDRINVGGDNGQALFEYVVKNHPEIDVYFVVDQFSETFNELSKIGHVVAYGSIKHHALGLAADRLISSHADDFVIKFLPNNLKAFYMLFIGKYVFLQHGIALGIDLSTWCFKNAKNFSAFILSSKREFEVNGISSLPDFDYEEKVWKLTGLPRYDLLMEKQNSKTEKEKVILFMPTWRKELVSNFNAISGQYPYSSKFKESDYYQITNDLLNSEKLIQVLKEKNYRMKFVSHPSLKHQDSDYALEEGVVSFITEKYVDLLVQGDILITDFSSVHYDFDYLKKPVYYLDINNEQDALTHLAESYDFEAKLPFGEKFETVDALVDVLVSKIETDSLVMPLKYQKVVDEIFEYHDTNNCKRVYEAIQNI